MRKVDAKVVAVVAFGAVGALAADLNQRPEADKPNPIVTPPSSGTSSSDLARSGGVIAPPADVDPHMKRMPPPSADPMPVVRPPCTPGGDPSINPK